MELKDGSNLRDLLQPNYLYGYALQNPIGHTDKSGLCPPGDDRCREVKNDCIVICSRSLPTGDNGFAFFNCVNRCMSSAGCL